MALTIFYMIAFSAILAIRNIRSKFNLLFILMVFGMSISMFTILSEIFKSSNYLVSSAVLAGRIEYTLFLLISSIFRLALSDLLIVRNLGIITYLIAIMLFSISFNKSVTHKTHSKLTKYQIGHYVFLGVFPLTYFYFYHPNTAYAFYLKIHSSGGSSATLYTLLYLLNIVFILLTILYLAYPILLLIKNFRQNRISFFSQQLFALAISLGLLNITFFSMFFIGSFRTSVADVYHSGFWRYKLSTYVPEYYTHIVPTLSVLSLLIIVLIMIKFRTDRMISGIKNRAIKRNLRILNANVKDVMHSNKNVMFNLKILSEDALKNYGTDAGKAQLEKILDLSANNMTAITKTLDNIKELKFRTIHHNLVDSIEEALLEIDIPDHIEIVKTYHETHAFCQCDMFHMTQVITNLLTNAIDAIHAVESVKMINQDSLAESTMGQITITLDSSMDWVFLSITDNGCGVPKRLQKKIFYPYFSTKSKQNNWGIGLSYVFRVINYHYGHLRFKSVAGVATTVEILLPKSHPKFDDVPQER